jgi:hypothetical protein
VHQPIRDTVALAGNYQIEAIIQHRSGIANANIYYTIDTTQTYQTVPMTLASGDTWQGFIPAQSGGTEVFYYIEGTANSGKTQNRPMPAPQGFWNFWIDQSVTTEQPQNLTIAMANVFPNPATDKVFVPIIIEKPIVATIQLFDVTGRLVQTVFKGKINGSYIESIDVSELSKGIYFLSLQTKEGIQTQKIIVE